MTSKHLDSITEHLAILLGHAFFRTQDGPLHERLAQEVLNTVSGELVEKLSGGAFDLEVSIQFREEAAAPVVSFSIDHPEVAHTAQMPVTALAVDALEDLVGYLARLSALASPAESEAEGKTQQQKRHDADHHEKGPASARLKVSPEWLKRVVPCTDYSYEEIDGKKYIREYYWSKELIERLFKIKSTKTTPEDLQYVAKECCEGDLEWARDLIARIKSPNRPESPPKEQSQKPQQGRAPQQGRGAQVQAVPSERQRSRSRHKKPAREPGKEGGAKSETAAAQKGTRP